MHTHHLSPDSAERIGAATCGKAFARSFVTVCGTLIVALGLIGCGGPKYQGDFEKWFGMFVAEKMPAKVTTVSVEEAASGDAENIFQFTASGETTEDLYTSSQFLEVQSLNALVESTKDFSDRAVRAAGIEPLLSELTDGYSEPRMVLQVASPKGTKVGFHGKVRAKQEAGVWKFSVIELTQDELPGSRRANFPRALIKGSNEEKEATEKSSTLQNQLRDAVTLAEKINAEENRVAAAEAERIQMELDESTRKQTELRQAEDAKLAKERATNKALLLKHLASGNVFHGTWRGVSARGTMGLRCGKGTDAADGYSMDAEIFDIDKPEFIKKVSGMVSGDGGTGTPFVLELHVTDHESEIATYQHRDGSALGFVAGNSRFTLPLTFDADAGTLSGTLERNFMFEYGPEGPVSFVFRPKESAEKAPSPGEKSGDGGAIPHDKAAGNPSADSHPSDQKTTDAP